MIVYENIFIIFFSCFIIACATVYWYIQKNHRYWSEKNVVSITALPIIGSYSKQLALNNHAGEISKEIYDNHKNEKVVGTFRGSEPELQIQDPDIIKSILIKDFNYFHDRSTTANPTAIISQNLFSLNGDRWRMLRQKLTPTFTSSKMRQMFPLISRCGDELQGYIKELTKDEKEIEVKEVMAKFTTDTIGTCAFGLKMQSMADDNAPFRKVGKSFFQMTRTTTFIRYIKLFTPRFYKIVGFFISLFVTNVMQMTEDFFVKLVKEIIASRKSSSERHHDFMDLMIELKNMGSVSYDKNDKFVQTAAKDITITDDLIVAQAVVFFLAGFETSSTTMSYALYELAGNPDVQKKLQDEIDVVLKKYNNDLTYDAIQDMKYLDMVVSETLRKYPPVANLQRQCISKYKLEETQTDLEKGVLIIVPVYALHHDEKYFPEPEKFLPERFSSDSCYPIQPYTYLPFGDGPRNCIGFRFGKLQSLSGLATILRKYTVEPCSKTESKIKFDPVSPVMTSKGGIWLKMKPRT